MITHYAGRGTHGDEQYNAKVKRPGFITKSYFIPVKFIVVAAAVTSHVGLFNAQIEIHVTLF